ncbi:MAG: hypothetical protein ABJB74_04525 [Gemmatimonas sp.]
MKTSVGILTAIVVTVLVAACTDKIDGGAACPDLCPTQPNTFKDTTLFAVELDTTISGFPTFGLGTSILLANRPDTLETRAVIRFDVLPTEFTPNNSGEAVTIATVDSAFLRVVIDSTGARGAAQVELQAYDVDTTDVSPSSAVIQSLFRPDRLLGTIPITTVAARDTVRIPISKTVLEKKLADHSRFRIGIRLVGATSAQVRIVQQNSGFGSPLLAFDPSSDTTYLPLTVSPNTAIGVDADELLGASVSTLLVRGTPDADAQSLTVGGFPSRRSYLRFNVPASILDSATVVRAELILTQRPVRGLDPKDTIAVVPLIGVSSTLVTDIRRIMELAAPGLFAAPALDSLLVVPSDSGTKSLNLLGVIRNWSALPTTVTRALILRSSHEGSEPAEARFYSIEAPIALRPRIRITYLPRVDRALP